MPKQTYVPTETDRLTGENVRRLRRAAGETLQQTIDGAGLGFSGQSLSRIELGQRQLTVPEATKLAAHFNTTVDRIITKPVMDVHPSGRVPYKTDEYPGTEQEWLGNTEPKPALFAVPAIGIDGRDLNEGFMTIDLKKPLHPDEYRDQVWIPYLEQRYATDLRQTG